MVKLGNKYKDSISGFSGIATARTIYLTGCIRVCLEPNKLDKEGFPTEAWFDEMMLKTTSGKKVVSESPPAGPSKTPVSRSNPA